MASARQSWPRATEEKNGIFLSALRKAYEAGFTEGVRLTDDSEILEVLEKKIGELDFWAFDAQPEPKLKKTSSGKKVKKVTPKKPALSNDLASAEFNPDCCRARFWNQKDKGDVPVDQPGHGMQCWRVPDPDLDGGYCEKCFNLKTEPDQRTSTTHWFGDFDKPLSESPGEKKDGSPLHDWPAMKKTKPKKEKKTSEKKAKKEKKPKKAKKVKKAKKEPEVEVKIEDIENPVDVVGDEEPDVENAGEGEEDDDKTQELSDDELGEDTGSEMVEYEHDGFSLLWNKKTNELIDPDDSEVMGTMVADEEGNWKAHMKEDGSDDDESDSEEEEE